MKHTLILIITLLLLSINASLASAQQRAVEDLERLRLQLLDLQQKENALKLRVDQLEEALKPENIERSLAGVGSTKPEELREFRRRQLTIERDGVLAQLKTTEMSRTSVEAAITAAETRAYQESAAPTPLPTSQSMTLWSITPFVSLLLRAATSLLLIPLSAIIFLSLLNRSRV